MYKIHDISMAIYPGMTVYKNKPEKQPGFERVQNNYVSETRVSLDVHGGTHVDAPLHMVIDGDTIETIPVENLVGPCRVLDLSHVTDGISAADFAPFDIQEEEFILLKTANSKDETFNPDFIYVNEEGARFLVEKRIKGVGIDSLGIERSQPGHPTHKTLFGAQIIIIEGLRLSEVSEGRYFMMGAPIKLLGTDASPARVLLIEGITY
ncbi:cyclase family protein [Ammoniphilus sp. YIM 78166]|uniref:cyclase family protein n=1 Tax=Ammoniphilus sp. YIM 78166 TaxID=1644106 RepID=UPI00106F6D7F|nr:cyclase family protein [Ammoniphilus sp. YIM 78166]